MEHVEFTARVGGAIGLEVRGWDPAKKEEIVGWDPAKKEEIVGKAESKDCEGCGSPRRIRQRPVDHPRAGPALVHPSGSMIGTLYESAQTALPNANETHTVPSGLWRVVVTQDPTLQVAAFIMDQDIARSADVRNHLVAVDDIELRSGLELFPAFTTPQLGLTRFRGRVRTWVSSALLQLSPLVVDG